MSSPTVEDQLGQAIDLASFEQYLQLHLRPIVDSFLDGLEGNDWKDLIEGAFNQFTTTVALAQLGEAAPRAFELAKLMGSRSEEVTGAILLSLALRP